MSDNPSKTNDPPLETGSAQSGQPDSETPESEQVVYILILKIRY